MLFAHFRLTHHQPEAFISRSPPAVCCSRGFSVLFDYILFLRFRILEDYYTAGNLNVPAVSSFVIGDLDYLYMVRMAIPVQLNS
jgi:hypothetical protein